MGVLFISIGPCFTTVAFGLKANPAYKTPGLDSNPARTPAEHQGAIKRVRIPDQLLVSAVRLARVRAAVIVSENIRLKQEYLSSGLPRALQLTV